MPWPKLLPRIIGKWVKPPCGPAAVMEEHTSPTNAGHVTEQSGRRLYALKPKPEDLPRYRISHKVTVNSWCRKETHLRSFFVMPLMLFCVGGIFYL